MYGLLALAVLGLVETMLATFEGKARGWWVVLWIPLGVHSHYYFFHYGLVLAVCVLVAAAFTPAWRRCVLRLIPPALLGLSLCLPWLLTGFRAQLTHDLPSGGTAGLYANWKGFAQSIAHLLFMNSSIGGTIVTFGVALPGALAGTIIGGLGLARLWRLRRESHGALLLLLVAAGLLVPAWSVVFSRLVPRAGYNWRYVAGSCVPVLLIVAAGVRWTPLARRALSTLLIAAMACVTIVTAIMPAQEDYRGAVSHILHHTRPGDAVITHPTRYTDSEHAPTGWGYYVQRAPRPTALALGMEPKEYRTPRWRGAMQHERVWLFTRYRFPVAILDELEARYEVHEAVQVGTVLTVHLFAGEPNH